MTNRSLRVATLFLVICLCKDIRPTDGLTIHANTPAGINGYSSSLCIDEQAIVERLISNPRIDQFSDSPQTLITPSRLLNPELKNSESNAYALVTGREAYAFDHTLAFPSYLSGQLYERVSRNENGRIVYGASQSRKRMGSYDTIEFIKKDFPGIRLVLAYDKSDHDQKHVLHFQLIDDQAGQSWQELVPCGHESNTEGFINLEWFAIGRHFLDLIAGIPLEMGVARSHAIRRWLTDLQSEGLAFRRDSVFNVGFWTGIVRIPLEVVSGRTFVEIWSEAGRHIRFLRFVDNAFPGRDLILEADHKGRVFLTESGQDFSLRRSGYFNLFDYRQGRHFFAKRVGDWLPI